MPLDLELFPDVVVVLVLTHLLVAAMSWTICSIGASDRVSRELFAAYCRGLASGKRSVEDSMQLRPDGHEGDTRCVICATLFKGKPEDWDRQPNVPEGMWECPECLWLHDVNAVKEEEPK